MIFRFFIVRRELAPLVCVAMCTRATSYAARPQSVKTNGVVDEFEVEIF